MHERELTDKEATAALNEAFQRVRASYGQRGSCRSGRQGIARRNGWNSKRPSRR